MTVKTAYPKMPLYLLAIIMLVTGLLYLNTINGSFLNWDDLVYIVNNNYLKSITPENTQHLFSTERHTFLVLMSFSLENALWGMNTTPYHLINILIHLINIMLVYFFIRKLSGNAWVALITAVLFALHPTRSESVGWIMQRKDVLSGMFSFIALLLYLSFLRKQKLRSILYIFIVFTAFLASLCKIQALTLVLVFFLLDFYYKKPFYLSIIEKAPILALMIFVPVNISWFAWGFYLLIPVVIVQNFEKIRKLKIKALTAIKNRVLSYVIRPEFILFFIYFIIFINTGANIISEIQETGISDIFLMGVRFFALLLLLTLLIRFPKTYLNIVFGLALVTIVVALLITTGEYFNISTNYSYKFTDRLLMAAYSMVYYLKTFIFPHELNAMHPYPDIAGKSFPQAYYIAPWILLALFAVFVLIIFKLRKYRKEIIFGLLFFVFSISIVLHIIPIHGRVVVADRYTYLAYTGLFYLAAVLIYGLYVFLIKKKIRFAVIAIFLIITIIFSFQTYSRNKVWNNDLVFWKDITEKSPANHYAIYSLGLAYIDRGELDQALKMYDKAINMYQGYTEYYVNRSGCLIKLQRYEDAINDLNRVISEQPDNAIAYNNRGIAWFRLLEYEKALSDYDKALFYDPEYKEAANNREKAAEHLQYIKAALSGDFSFNVERAAFFNDLGVVKGKQGDFLSALQLLKYAMQYNPGNPDIYVNMGNVYVNLNMLPEAVLQYDKVIAMKPASAQAYLFRGNTLHQMKKVDAACADWHKAMELGMKQAEAMIEKYCR